MKVEPELIPIIEEMMWEFMDNKLQVSKVASMTHENSFNRVPVSTNPIWYQKMCKDFPRPIQPSNKRIKLKKPRTIVKRQEVVKLFKRLIEFSQSESQCAPYIIGEAEKRLESWTPPNYEEDIVPF